MALRGAYFSTKAVPPQQAPYKTTVKFSRARFLFGSTPNRKHSKNISLLNLPDFYCPSRPMNYCLRNSLSQNLKDRPPIQSAPNFNGFFPDQYHILPPGFEVECPWHALTQKWIKNPINNWNTSAHVITCFFPLINECSKTLVNTVRFIYLHIPPSPVGVDCSNSLVHKPVMI